MAGQVPPFYTGFRLVEIELDCGTITDTIYDRAPGGAYGKVFFGRWSRLRVAVKILATRPDVAPDDAAAAFRLEVENMIAVRSTIDRANALKHIGAPLFEPCDVRDSARRCNQPHGLRGWVNAAVVFGVGFEPDLAAAAPGLPPGPAHLIVMEELTGGTLKEIIDTAPSSTELVKTSMDIARGLELLAAAHVVHADLKCDNVMRRTPRGDVVLTDYGVGRIANAGVDTGDAKGNMLYLAPELISGGHANTFASDVYSYGLVLWCLFSGRSHPFMDAAGHLPATIAILDRVRAGGRPDLAALRLETPPAVRALIQRCWAQDPDTRPSALTLAKKTESWLMEGRISLDLAREWLRSEAVSWPKPGAPHDELETESSSFRAPRDALEVAARSGISIYHQQLEPGSNRYQSVAHTYAAALETLAAAEVIRSSVASESPAHKIAEVNDADSLSAQTAATLPVAVAVPAPQSFAHLSPESAAWLQARLPTGGSSSPSQWEEVYRAKTHGFGASAFHARCDGRARLLVLVQAREGGWLFGGFTAVGFIPGAMRSYADPAAFLFSLTNSLGHPEKLESKQTGEDLIYHPSRSASFGGLPSALFICNNADLQAGSLTHTGRAYAESSSTGAHPMAQGLQKGWHAADIIAWVV